MYLYRRIPSGNGAKLNTGVSGVEANLRCRSGGAEFVSLRFSCHLVLPALGLH